MGTKKKAKKTVFKQVTLPGADAVRELRRRRGWSQAQLASKLVVHVPTVSAWERGKSVPHRSHQERLARLMTNSNVTAQWPARKRRIRA